MACMDSITCTIVQPAIAPTHITCAKGLRVVPGAPLQLTSPSTKGRQVTHLVLTQSRVTHLLITPAQQQQKQADLAKSRATLTQGQGRLGQAFLAILVIKQTGMSAV